MGWTCSELSAFIVLQCFALLPAASCIDRAACNRALDRRSWGRRTAKGAMAPSGPGTSRPRWQTSWRAALMLRFRACPGRCMPSQAPGSSSPARRCCRPSQLQGAACWRRRRPQLAAFPAAQACSCWLLPTSDTAFSTAVMLLSLCISNLQPLLRKTCPRKPSKKAKRT